MKLISKVKGNIIKKKMKACGSNVIIEDGAHLSYRENISLGNNIYIGENTKLFGMGGIQVGSGTIIAHNVEIMSMNHNYNSLNLRSLPYDEEYIFKPVIIKENVWIGSNVLITPGVHIGEGVVIGMGSVVTKNIPEFSIVGGNPAKIIKRRDIDIYHQLKEKNKIYLDMKNNKRS